MTDERWEMVDRLRTTGAAFVGRVAEIGEGDWATVPPGGGWSLAHVAEHVTLVEVSTGKLISRKLFTETASDELLAATAGKERGLIVRLPDRTNRIVAPDFVTPTGRWGNRDELLRAFEVARESNIVQLCDPTRDLRRYAAPHPIIGPLDAYQWGLFLSLHLQRHLDQMDEILGRLGEPAGG
jgi:hypothetical protein